MLIDPNFARWLFVLKRLRQPGLQVRDLPPIDLVLVTHAHFDHLHRPSLRAIVRQTKRRQGWRRRSWFRIMFSIWSPTWDSKTWWNWTGGTATGIAA